MSSVFKLAETGLSSKSCVEGFNCNLASCCMALAPVSGKMFVFHHLIELGGSVADPTSKVVALKGIGPSAMPIQLKLDSLEDQDKVKVPTWANIKK
eukprot:4186247-Ditylum_brightwellii.AAC.1